MLVGIADRVAVHGTRVPPPTRTRCSWKSRRTASRGAREVEKVLSHETCGDFVAARQVLDLRLGPSSALFDFYRGDKPRAAQACKVPMPLGVRHREGLYRSRPVVPFGLAVVVLSAILPYCWFKWRGWI